MSRERLRRLGIHPAALGLPYRLWDPRVLAEADGVAVGSLTDVGPKGEHVTNTGTARPLMQQGVNGINGVNALLFDGGDDFLFNDAVAADFTGSDKPMTILAVALATSAGTQGTIASLGSSSSGTPVHRLRLGTTDLVTLSRTDNAAGAGAAAARLAITVGLPFVTLCRFSGTDADIWLNGERVSASSALDVGALTVNRFGIGCRRITSNLNFWVGKMGLVEAITGWVPGPEASLLSRWAMNAYRIPG